MLSIASQDCLKAILQLGGAEGTPVATNALARRLGTRPATVHGVVTTLAARELVDHSPYKGVVLTGSGRDVAVGLVCRHRLWEVFLFRHLGFRWDEVHAIAEQLEHVEDPVFVERFDRFLGHPEVDPHGDPIPRDGAAVHPDGGCSLAELPDGKPARIIGVLDSSEGFLRHLTQLGVELGSRVVPRLTHDFDGSRSVLCGKPDGSEMAEAVWSVQTCDRLRVAVDFPSFPSA
jgi:DtxR family Mn-dependent transcriptional regulator